MRNEFVSKNREHIFKQRVLVSISTDASVKPPSNLLAGESSGLLGAGESKWPFANGYTFATWLYVESFQELATTAAAAAAAAAAASAATRAANKASPGGFIIS